MQIIVDIAVPTSVFFLMWVVGLGLTPSDFRLMATQRLTTVVGTFGPMVVLPLTATAVILLLRPPEAMVAGLILVASAPGAPISNLFVYLGRGNTALSVTLTALSNCIGILTFPLLAAAGFALFLGGRAVVGIPLSTMVEQLVLLMLLPIALGMIARRLWYDQAVRYREPLKRASFVTIMGIVALIVAANRSLFAEEVIVAIGAAALLVVGGMLVGLGAGRIINTPFPERLAILVEFSLRNTAISIVVAVTTLGRVDYAMFVVVYFVVEMVVVVGLVGVLRLLDQRREAVSG